MNKGRIFHILEENINRGRIRDTALKSTNETMQAIVRNEEKFEEYVDEKIKNYNKRVGTPDPGDTRKWINQIYLFKFVVDNKTSLQRLCRQEKAKEYVDRKVGLRDMLNDEELFEEATNMYMKMEPIFIACVEAQSAKQNLSDIYMAFDRTLPSFYVGDDKEDVFVEALKKGWDLIEGPIHYASVAVDVRFDGALQAEEMMKAEDYFELVLGEEEWDLACNHLYDFVSRRGVFKHRIFNKAKPTDSKEEAVAPWAYYTKTRDNNTVRGRAHIKFGKEVIFLLGARTGISECEKTFCEYRRAHDWTVYLKGDSLLDKQVSYKINWSLEHFSSA